MAKLRKSYELPGLGDSKKVFKFTSNMSEDKTACDFFVMFFVNLMVNKENHKDSDSLFRTQFECITKLVTYINFDTMDNFWKAFWKNDTEEIKHITKLVHTVLSTNERL